MPGLGPRAPDIPTYKRSYQAIRHSAIKNNQGQAFGCLFLIFPVLRAELSTVVATSQICLSIINIVQTTINLLYF